MNTKSVGSLPVTGLQTLLPSW